MCVGCSTPFRISESEGFAGDEGFEFREDVGVVGAEEADDFCVIEEFFHIPPDDGEVEHVLAVGFLDGLEIAFEGFHFAFQLGDLLGAHAGVRFVLFRVQHLLFFRTENEGFGVGLREIVGGDHQFRHLDLADLRISP